MRDGAGSASLKVLRCTRKPVTDREEWLTSNACVLQMLFRWQEEWESVRASHSSGLMAQCCGGRQQETDTALWQFTLQCTSGTAQTPKRDISWHFCSGYLMFVLISVTIGLSGYWCFCHKKGRVLQVTINCRTDGLTFMGDEHALLAVSLRHLFSVCCKVWSSSSPGPYSGEASQTASHTGLLSFSPKN